MWLCAQPRMGMSLRAQLVQTLNAFSCGSTILVAYATIIPLQETPLNLPIPAPFAPDPRSLPASHATLSADQQVIKKVSRHLLGFLFLLFVVSFLDRINIGFAGLTMMNDLVLPSTQLGL